MFGNYNGKDFFKLKLPKRKWLIEGFLKEKDSMMLVGDEKSGKSLMAFQMICSLVSGYPFLNKYKVVRPCKVTYLQLEGQLEDSQDRFNRMRRTLDFDEDMFQIMFSQPISLDDITREEANKLILHIKRIQVPDVLVIDPVYFALDGDLVDNCAVRKFLGSIRIIKEELGCAIIWVHHTHKIKVDKNGNIVDEGDEATFGSKFFKAYPDHCILFAYDKKRELRVMSCNTQRSGDIVKQTKLKLIEPSPLHFIETEQVPERNDIVLHKLAKYPEGLSIGPLKQVTDLAESTCYMVMAELIKAGVVEKSISRPVTYKALIHSMNPRV